MLEIINFWNNFHFESGIHQEKPYQHPEDISHLKKVKCYNYRNFENYVNDEEFWKSKELFHFYFIPVPYVGDLKNAKVFILFLNPGHNVADYNVEEQSLDFREALEKNLYQKWDLANDFPLFYLNPKFLGSPGGEWCKNKLKDYVIAVKEENPSYSYLESLKVVSKKIAFLELVPYHSSGLKNSKLIGKLPSVNRIKEFVQCLVERAKNDEICIICTRQVDQWGLEKYRDMDIPNLLIYEKKLARSASISKKSKAYPLIRKFLFKAENQYPVGRIGK